MKFPFTNECTNNCVLSLCPVPGALRYPRRSLCEQHGYPKENNKMAGGKPDQDRPNDYATEVASPADVREIAGELVSQY